MTLSPTTRTALLALAAAILLGALAYLFVRSAAIDFRRDAETGALLRELRALDARVDSDAQRIARHIAPETDAPSDRSGLLERILRELGQSATPAVAARLPELRTGMTEKAKALDALRGAHGRSLEALKAADEAVGALATQANAARLANPRASERAMAAASQAEIVRLMLRSVPLEGAAAAITQLEPRIATLREAAVSADPKLADAGAAAQSAAKAYLEARLVEAKSLDRLTFQTIGPRIDLALVTLTKGTEIALGEQERWRLYLFYYAGALLIVVAYLVTRVIASQAALRAANEGLEKAVAARTKELSAALVRLKESEAQLVQTEKMSSLGQMVAGVAHEINTPLAYVKNSVATARDRMPELRESLVQSEHLLALLQSDAPDQEELQKTFGSLSSRLAQMRSNHVLEDLDALTKDGLHGIEEISELVANLKNFSRLDRSKVASFNVNDGVNATLLIARTNLRKVEIEKRLGEVPAITCSPSQVNQVLLNLVTNAAQAIEGGKGLIVITTRPEGRSSVAIEVADNGKGIPPEVLPKIFDPFFTTKEVGKGTGLGLSIAYKIVEQHGGRIDVKSKVGQGTIFTVTLPVTPPPELAQAEGAPAAA